MTLQIVSNGIVKYTFTLHRSIDHTSIQLLFPLHQLFLGLPEPKWTILWSLIALLPPLLFPLNETQLNKTKLQGPFHTFHNCIFFPQQSCGSSLSSYGSIYKKSGSTAAQNSSSSRTTTSRHHRQPLSNLLIVAKAFACCTHEGNMRIKETPIKAISTAQIDSWPSLPPLTCSVS